MSRNLLKKFTPKTTRDTKSAEKLPRLNQNQNKKQILIDREHLQLTINLQEIDSISKFISKVNEKCPQLDVTGFKFNGKEYSVDSDESLESIFTESTSQIYTISTPKRSTPTPPLTPQQNNNKGRLNSTSSKNDGRIISLQYPELPEVDEIAFNKIPIDQSTQITLSFINLSNSMLLPFDEHSKCSEIGIEIINAFKQSLCDYTILDPFLFFKNDFTELTMKLNHQLDIFKYDKSTIISLINKAIYYFKNSNYGKLKRIFLVTDCLEDERDFSQICKSLLSENIILDAVILSNKEVNKEKPSLIKNICSASHITGGIYFVSQSKEEILSFIELEMLSDLSQRSFSHFKRSNQIEKYNFDSISENIELDIPLEFYQKKSSISFYQDMSLISPFAEVGRTNPIFLKIKEQIEICASYQQEKKEEKFFQIYYLYDNYNHAIDPKKALVFINGKCSDQDIVYQILIRFPNDFPKVPPSFFLLSGIKLNENKSKSNGLIIFGYKKENPTLLQALYDVKQLLISDEKFDNKLHGPVDSLNKIESIFHVYYGNKVKRFRIDKKEMEIIKK